MMHNLAYGVLALLMGGAGMGLLFGSWRGFLARNLWPVTTGWLLLLLSIIPWSAALGAEFGVSVALLVVAVLAWVVVLFNIDTRPTNGRAPQTRNGFHWPQLNVLLHHGLRLILTIPVAAVVSILVSLTLTDWLPWQQVNRLVFATLWIPVVWGCAIYWLCADRKLLRPAASLFAAGALCAVYLYG